MPPGMALAIFLVVAGLAYWWWQSRPGAVCSGGVAAAARKTKTPIGTHGVDLGAKQGAKLGGTAHTADSWLRTETHTSSQSHALPRSTSPVSTKIAVPPAQPLLSSPKDFEGEGKQGSLSSEMVGGMVEWMTAQNVGRGDTISAQMEDAEACSLKEDSKWRATRHVRCPTSSSADSADSAEARAPPTGKPINDVEAILHWTALSHGDPLSVSMAPVIRRRVGPMPIPGMGAMGEGPKLMVCHDFRGNYRDDRFTQGVRGPLLERPYSIHAWDCIDTFVCVYICVVAWH